MPALKVKNIVFRHDDLFELQLERGDVGFELGRRRFSWTLIWGRVPVSKEIDHDNKQQERNCHGTAG